MVRLIKRYESRKLYDTEESRYVSLQEIADFIRQGQEVRVVDNASASDVTAQTLTQLILDEGRTGRTKLPTELLHDLVRFGEEKLSSGVEQVQTGVESLVQASIDRLGPVRRAREEMARLRERLEAREEMARLRERLERLEATLGDMGSVIPTSPAPKRTTAAKKAPAKRTAAAKRPTAVKTRTVKKRTVKKATTAAKKTAGTTKKPGTTKPRTGKAAG